MEFKIGIAAPLHGDKNKGAQRGSGAIIAVDHLNQGDETVLKNVTILKTAAAKFSFVVTDSQKSGTKGATAVLTAILAAARTCGKGGDTAPVAAWVGASSSSVSEKVAVITGLYQQPQISFASTSSALSSSIVFPFFARTVPPDTLQGLMIAQIIVRFQWNYIATVCTEDYYGAGVIDQVKTNLAHIPVTTPQIEVTYARSLVDAKVPKGLKASDAKAMGSWGRSCSPSGRTRRAWWCLRRRARTSTRL